MINKKLIIGAPIPFQDICYIYPPKVKDIIGNDDFFLYSSILTLSQEEIEDSFVEQNLDLDQLLTPLEYLLNNAYNDVQLNAKIKKAFYCFTRQEILFLFEQKKIFIGKLSELKDVKKVDQLHFITEENYLDFQNAIREAVGLGKVEPPDPNMNPRLKKMKAKMRYRDKVKAKQGKGASLETSLLSICCMNMGINPLNIGELSYGVIQPLIRQYQEKEKYENDIRSLLAGADSKKIQLKYWIHNIED